MLALTKFALRRPITLILALITVFFFGLKAVLGSSMELMPDINMPYMIITTAYPGAGPEDVDELVSQVLEGGVSTLSGLVSVGAYSMENASVIVLQYEYGTDMDTSYLELRKALDAKKPLLPEKVKDPVLLELDINAQASMNLTISGGSDENLYNYVNDKVLPELEKIPSVAELSLAGGRKNYIRIELLPEKLAQYRLSMDSLAMIIGSADFTMPSGKADFGNQNLNISAGGDYKDIERIKNIVIPLAGGDLIHLHDIANVYDALEDESSLSRFNGEDVISLAITKQQRASAVKLSKEVKQAIAKLEAGNEKLSIRVSYDSATSIKDALRSVFQTLIFAVILSMIVLFLFFGDIKASLIVGSSIPISVMMALTMIGAAGFSLNLISVGSLALGVGMIVDASIVMLESCFRVKKEQSFYEAALEGSRKVLSSITGSTITTCVVFFPLALLKGLSGQLFSQLGFTIVFCMLASLFSAAMIVPMLYLFFHPQEKEKFWTNTVLKAVRRGYRRAIGKSLHHRGLVVLVSFVLLVVSVFMASRLGTELMPEGDEGLVRISAKTRPGMKIEEVDAVGKEIEAIVKADEDVKDYELSYTGQGFGRNGEESSLSVTAYLRRDRRRSTDQVIADWKPKMGRIENASIILRRGSNTGMSAGGTTANVQINLQSPDYELLKSTTEEIVGLLRKEPYITKVHSNMENAAPLIKIDIDPLKAQALGLSSISLANTLNTAISGKEVMNYTKNGSEITVKLEYPKRTYDRFEDIRDMLIDTPTGTQVVLSEVADIRFEDSALTLARYNKQYQAEITAEIVEGYKDSALRLSNAFVDRQELPEGVSRADNEYTKMMMEELGALLTALVTAVFLIFIVMAMQFESPRFSFIVMFTIPFSLIGAFGLLFLAGVKINMMAMIGFLMMVGTVVNNGILYVDTVNQNRERMDLQSALVESGAIRIRPILMTTLTTVLAMVPMALAYGDSGEQLQGLALVNVGGLLASTLLSLLLLPTFYSLVYKKKKEPEDA